VDLKDYISSGIIESYVLGLATPDEEKELDQMRRLFPELNTEIQSVEKKVESLAFAEAVMPPAQARNEIVQRIDWHEGNNNTRNNDNSNYTFINLNPNSQDNITVHKWWRIAFITLVVLSKIFLFFAILYYLKFKQAEENKSSQAAPATTTVQQPVTQP